MPRVHLADVPFTLSPNNLPLVVDNAMRGTVRTVASHSGMERKKVAIVGAGMGKDEAPYDDPEWEVWALNVCSSWDSEGRLRADRWFELHEMHAQSADDLRWMAKCPTPIYLVPSAFTPSGHVKVPLDPDPPKPNHDFSIEPWAHAVRYPLERIEEQYGAYWACTFAYQIALALDERFTDIGLYGVELAFGTMRERTVERACVEWWCGYAEAKGVTLHMPMHSTLACHVARYGVEYDDEIKRVKDYLALMENVDVERQKITAGIMGG